MPKKIRALIAQLEKARFVNIGGKGSHRNFKHGSGAKVTIISGKLGEDAKIYQEKATEKVIEESKK